MSHTLREVSVDGTTFVVLTLEQPTDKTVQAAMEAEKLRPIAEKSALEAYVRADPDRAVRVVAFGKRIRDPGASDDEFKASGYPFVNPDGSLGFDADWLRAGDGDWTEPVEFVFARAT